MKATNQQKEKAKQYAKNFGAKHIFLNNKGEYFTSENYAAISVKNNTSRYIKIDCSSALAEDDKSANTTQTNNTDKQAAEVLKSVEQCTCLEDLEVIYNTEQQGNKRPAVLEACEEKLNELSKTNE
jgi:hypothetical protein